MDTVVGLAGSKVGFAPVKDALIVMIAMGLAALLAPVTPGTIHGRIGRWVRLGSLILIGVSAIGLLAALIPA